MTKKNRKHDRVEVVDPTDILGIFENEGVEFIPEPLPSRPEKVRIFGKDYAIQYLSPHLGMEDYGKIDFHNSIINIQEYQLSYDEADTLLHEVIHGVEHVMDLKLSERQVLALASGLMGVFQDNQEFAKFIIAPRTLASNRQ